MNTKKKNRQKIYREMKRLLKNGTEERLKNFLIDNFWAFPKRIREEIIFTFVEESLTRAIEKNKKRIKFQKKIAEAIKFLEKSKKKLTERKV